jgi:HEPN domain-containing protein
LPRRTDSSNPADWLLIAASDLEGIRLLIGREVSYRLCASKLAEILEKVLKAELIRVGWFLEKTHDLLKLGGELRARSSDLAERVRPLCESLAERYFADRYPGFDLEDADWPSLRAQADEVAEVLSIVRSSVSGGEAPGGTPPSAV